MKCIISIVGLFLLISCNTKYNMIETGLVNGKFDGNMYEYLQSNHYDWDSTRLMVERANLVDLFEGKRAGYEQITFFGPTNHSIRRYMLQKGYSSVAEIEVDTCYKMIMECVVKGKHMRDDIPLGKEIAQENTDDSGDNWDDSGDDWEYPDGDMGDGGDENTEDENPDQYKGTGGTVFTGEMGNRFWIYSFQDSYNEVAGVGAIVLFIKALDNRGKHIDIASTNIEPTNGVVHSLHYNFTLGDFIFTQEETTPDDFE
ncbi:MULTISPECIES: hypothetical protein [Butyricimonas]|uniref:Lipoprotein n=1 Tax=Butyricimonas hominis TaxID=2763032 RepID=A0ABR7D285_9BACT|nr:MULTISPECIES: hypothetical protein [Butyricimonas]MBC5622044.1 hypothetical protein [Butyricimonas hominis]